MERGSEVNKAKSYRLFARFVEHVTYPISTKVLPGEEFTKVWRVRNDAEGPWPNDVELIYVSGEAGKRNRKRDHTQQPFFRPHFTSERQY